MSSTSTERPSASALATGPGRADFATVRQELEAIGQEHAQRQALNEELFRSLSSDPSIDASERQSARIAAATAQEVCAEVDLALRAIEDGTYGTCTSCHDAIPIERLEAVPLTRTCVACPPR